MSKCCYIHFRPRKREQNETENTHELFIQNFPIKKVSKTKFLGVVIDDKLSWDAHITALRRKLGLAASTFTELETMFLNFTVETYITPFMSPT